MNDCDIRNDENENRLKKLRTLLSLLLLFIRMLQDFWNVDAKKKLNWSVLLLSLAACTAVIETSAMMLHAPTEISNKPTSCNGEIFFSQRLS